MPKERVQHGTLNVWPKEATLIGEAVSEGEIYLPGDKIPEGYILREAPSVDVLWNREGEWVQLAIDAPRDWWERFMASYENSPEQHSFPVVTEVLTRKEINHLIRTLRRARDAAYGADE